MRSIDELNAEYLRHTKDLSTIEECVKEMNSLKSRMGDKSIYYCLSEIAGAIKFVAPAIDPDLSDGLRDLENVTQSGLRYIESISEYRGAMLKLVDGKQSAPYVLALENLQNKQITFEKSKIDFVDKYTFSISSERNLVELFLQLLSNEKDRIQARIEEVKSQAKEVLAGIETLELHSAWPNKENMELPESLFLARSENGSKPCALLSALGILTEFNRFDIHLRNQGNVLVETDFEHTLDKELDSFVLAYVFKFLEAFPIGMANVHIFDRNPNILNQRLSNIFKEGNYSERAKKTVNLHNYNSLSELNDIAGVITADIVKKTSCEYPDLYSIHAIDKSDPFTLIVLRDGLLDQGGHSASSILDTINAFTEPENTGHACGIRFLIIDDSSTNIKSISENADHLIKSIKDNCEIKINYYDAPYKSLCFATLLNGISQKQTIGIDIE